MQSSILVAFGWQSWPQPCKVVRHLTWLPAFVRSLVQRLLLEMHLLSSVIAKECNRVTGYRYIFLLSSLSGRRLYRVCYGKIAYVINLSILIWEQILDTTSFPGKASHKARIVCAVGFCIPFLFSPSPEVRYTTSDKICSGLPELLQCFDYWQREKFQLNAEWYMK